MYTCLAGRNTQHSSHQPPPLPPSLAQHHDQPLSRLQQPQQSPPPEPRRPWEQHPSQAGPTLPPLRNQTYRQTSYTPTPLPSAIPLDRQPLSYRPSQSDQPLVHQHLTTRGYQSQSNHLYPYLHHSQHSQHQYSQQQQHRQHHAQSHSYMPLNSDDSTHDYYAPQIRNRDHIAIRRSGHHSHNIGGISIRNYMAIGEVRSRRESYPNKKRRGNLPKEKREILTEWLRNNLDHPYPTDEQKQEFIRQTDLEMNQICNWFINARRRKCPDLIKTRERARRHLGPNDME